MPDMLVKLYDLPPAEPVMAAQAAQGITIRRALPPEMHLIGAWIEREFNAFWRSEFEVGMMHQPPGVFIAVEDAKLIGFACYDATVRGFFGPTGVSLAARGRGTGKALLIACLAAMRELGYGYAIIGGVGPAEFYAAAVGAVLIDGSSPGMYRGMLRGG